MSQTLVIGIDLGNSNCSMSYRKLGEGDSVMSKMVPLESDPEALSPNILPTAVLFPFDSSEPHIGASAHSRMKKGLLFANFKVRLMEAAEPKAVTESGVTKSPMDALTALLCYLGRQAFSHSELSKYFTLRQEQHVPREPIYLTLGVPAQAPEHYKNRLRRACLDSGWLTEEQVPEYLSFVAEPIGAALNYEPGERRHFFIFDDGGLTLDMVRIQVDESQSPPYKVLAYKERVTCTINGRSYNVGGNTLDRLLLRFALTRAGGVAALQELIMEAYEVEFDVALLEQFVQMEQDPPLAGREAKVYSNLCRDIERLRIGLSSLDSARWSLNGGMLPVKTRIVVKREDLDEAFRDVIQAIRQKLPKSFGQDEFCFMVGGCSLTLIFRAVMEEAIGRTRVLVPHAPMETIAAGLSRYSRAGIREAGEPDLPVSLVDDSVDTDYGIWNSDANRYDIVLAKGTSYSDASLPKSGIPVADKGIFRVYQPIRPSTEIVLRVGQYDPTAKDKWVTLGERTVHLPTPTTYFRIYFAMDPGLGQLEMRLFSTETKKLIPIHDPRFPISKIKYNS